jgi:SanA protein
MRIPPVVRRVALVAAGAVAALAVLVAGLNAFVLLREDGQATRDLAAVPHAQAAVVLGAYVEPGGRPSTMLADRLHQAAALYKAGKVDRVLVSGDHGTWRYDEPLAMRDVLLAEGIPARAIFTDHAGFNTWATMVRARRVFGVRDAIVVTQGFHMSRALYLAEEAGLRATGFDASLHDYGKQGVVSDVREVFSRVKAVGDTALDSGVVLGPAHPISGDGRKTWGPKPPAGGV